VVGVLGVPVPLPGEIADLNLEHVDVLQVLVVLDAAIVQHGLLSLDHIVQRPHFLIEVKQLRALSHRPCLVRLNRTRVHFPP